MKHAVLAIVLLAMVLAPAGCGKPKKFYPDLAPGWANPGYTHVFGRLQRLPAREIDGQPVWLVRFDLANTPHKGEFALGPAEKLTGYSGGELVEIRGQINSEFASPDYAGTWYNVQSIRMWSGKPSW